MAEPIRIPIPDAAPEPEPMRIPLDVEKPRGVLANAPEDSTLSSALKGTGTAAIKGLSMIAGMPGDLRDMVDYLVARAQNPLSHEDAVAHQQRVRERNEQIAKRFAAENPTLAAVLDAVPAPPTSAEVAAPVLSRTGEYMPTSDLGKYAMVGTEGAVGMLGPGGLARGLKAAGRGIDDAVGLAREVLKGGVKAAPAGAAANVAGTLATDVTGDPLSGILAGATVPMAVQAAVTPAKNYVAPMFSKNHQALADQKLFESTKDPAAALQAAKTAEIVPGSEPTLAELTGDPGLLRAQKAAQTVDQSDFNAQQAQQNAARIAELKRMAPADADVMAPSRLFREGLAEIDRLTQETLDRVLAQAKSANERLPNPATPEELGANLRASALSGIDASTRPAVQAAEAAARSADASIPGAVPPEVSGARLRDVMAAAAETARALRAKLYAAVDPDNTLSVVTTGARDAAKALAATIDPDVTLPSSFAAPVIEMVGKLGDVTPFKKLTDLDATISAQMSAAKRASDYTGHAQLLQMKQAVMADINNAIENQAKWQQGAVARGELAPENTIEAAIKRQVSDWKEAREAGRSISASAVGSDATRASVVPGGFRGEGEARGQPGVASRDTGVSGDVPNFDDEAAARLGAAKQAHQEYDATYRKGPAGGILKDTGFKGQYRVADSAVPATAFPSGDKGYDATSAFLRAAKNDPAAVSAIQDMAIARLRQEMGGGPLTTEQLDTWRRKYGNALRAIDEVSPGFSARFNDAATATDQLQNLTGGVAARRDVYDVPNAAAVDRVFSKGDKGFGTVSAWLQDAGRIPANVALLQDAAALRLRDAMKDGPLTPQKLAAWKQTYKEALRAIEEVSPGFSSRFDDVARANDVVGLAQKNRDNAVADYQKGIVGRYMNLTDPSEVVRETGSLLTAKDGPTKIKELLGVAGLNTDAVQGLRRAGVEYMLNDLSNAGMTAQGDRVLSSAKLRGFLSKNEGALKELYGSEHLANMRRVADDMERSQRAFDAMRVKGGSDSMSNAIQWMKDNAGLATTHTITGSMLISAFLQGFSGDMTGALAGLGSTAVKMAVDKLHANGVNSVRDLYLQGLLDPKVGEAMLQRAIDKNGNVNPSALKKVADAVAASTARSLYLNAPEEKRQARATGGKVMDHSSIAAQLIRSAESAHKAQTRTTEPLLAVPDDTVARALEIAGQGL